MVRLYKITKARIRILAFSLGIVYSTSLLSYLKSFFFFSLLLYPHWFLIFWRRLSLVMFGHLMDARSKSCSIVWDSSSIYILISRWYSPVSTISHSPSSCSLSSKNLFLICSCVDSGLRNILNKFFVIFSKILIHLWRLCVASLLGLMCEVDDIGCRQ